MLKNQTTVEQAGGPDASNQAWAAAYIKQRMADEILARRFPVAGFDPADRKAPDITPADLSRIPFAEAAQGDRTKLAFKALAFEGDLIVVDPKQARRRGVAAEEQHGQLHGGRRRRGVRSSGGDPGDCGG